MIERTESPAPLPARQPLPAGWLFTLVAGPLAWFVQLNVGYALTSAPCFAADQRLAQPAAPLAWTRTGAAVLVCACVVVALAAFWVSWRARRPRHAPGTERRDTGHRDRFIATWGSALSAGFALATLLTAAGLLLLPRCGG